MDHLRKSACLAISLWVALLAFAALSDDLGTDNGFDFSAEIVVAAVAAFALSHVTRVVDRRHAAHAFCLVVQADPRSPPRF